MLNGQLMIHFKWSLSDIENMIPWEREVYINIVLEHVRQKNEEIQKSGGIAAKKVEYAF